MSGTGLEVFDTTAHKTNGWLKELMDDLDWPERHKAYLALRTTLHALRDRLTVEEAAQLAAQLPMLVRGFYYEAWTPSDKPDRLSREQFLGRVAGSFRLDDDVDPEAVTRAVFALLARHLADGEIEDVQQMLPQDMRDLWA